MGKDHNIPDALSRSVPKTVLEFNPVQVDNQWCKKMLASVTTNPIHHSQCRILDGKLYKVLKRSYSGLLEPENNWALVVPKDHCRETEHDSYMSGKQTK